MPADPLVVFSARNVSKKGLCETTGALTYGFEQKREPPKLFSSHQPQPEPVAGLRGGPLSANFIAVAAGRGASSPEPRRHVGKFRTYEAPGWFERSWR